MADANIERVAGRACVVRGNDIDTDRIIPARYLRCVTFDGLGEHAFEDDRAQAKGDHPLDDERFAAARLLVVGQNFGSGSSREHAPQALLGRGFHAFVGGSFAEIFFGNCIALGLPCVTLNDSDLGDLMDAVELDPTQEVVVDLVAGTVTSRAGSVPADIPKAACQQLLAGNWDATSVLLEAGDAIEATASQIPYLSGFGD
jgi:3-isopropylmalate/(R)-2-methylmalate dehydratase small subunit